jgi:hypothetical protein
MLVEIVLLFLIILKNSLNKIAFCYYKNGNLINKFVKYNFEIFNKRNIIKRFTYFISNNFNLELNVVEDINLLQYFVSINNKDKKIFPLVIEKIILIFQKIYYFDNQYQNIYGILDYRYYHFYHLNEKGIFSKSQIYYYADYISLCKFLYFILSELNSIDLHKFNYNLKYEYIEKFYVDKYDSTKEEYSLYKNIGNLLYQKN